MNMLPRASLKTPHGKEFNLDSIRMTGDMRGQILNMQIVQEFCNSTSSHAEVIYTFPLPWRAVLMHVDVTIGEKKLKSVYCLVCILAFLRQESVLYKTG